jgi:hypothetical protein
MSSEDVRERAFSRKLFTLAALPGYLLIDAVTVAESHSVAI